MQLYQFANDKGATSLPADRLDDNFKRLRPLQRDGAARQYAVTETPEGWALEIFGEEIIREQEEQLEGIIQEQVPTVIQQQLPQLNFPAAPTTGTYVLGAVNGTVQWLATEDCD